MKEADYLEHKSHPAPISAKRVRDIARERRIIEEKLRIAQGIISYYQDLFPFLEEFLGEPEEEILKYILSRNIEEPIKEVGEIGIDPVRIYLSPLSEEEYQKLSTAERNQLALDRYWTKPKSKWQLGRDYERYIGYLYEAKGYNVYYQGILEGYDDLGRDLIAKKIEKTVLVQCKRWSQHKTIHEKHVNQLYGTVVKYMIDHPNEKVFAILYTTTSLSERSKEFASVM
ncbi:MAG: restriction endonuclease [Nitrospira sp.]|nr:restriction endonuclease [Nitrospira sp.]